MTWFWLTLCFIATMVFTGLVNKKTISHHAVDELVYGGTVNLFTGIICFVFALIAGWQYSFTSQSIVLIGLMLVTYVTGMSLYFIGLKKVELSHVAILDSLGAVWSLILGVILLNEPLVISKVIGICLIVTACALISVKSVSFVRNKYTSIIILSTFFYALGAVFDKTLNAYGSELSYLSITFGLSGMLMLLIIHKRTKAAFHGTFKSPVYWKGVSFNAVAYSIGFWCLFSAYQRGGEVSRMFPMMLSTYLIIPVLSIIVLKERDDIARKLVAVGVLLVGLWMIGK